ncbi:MAG: prolyl oligopeptidase family serine peptidase [Bacteroidota bacterium]
MKIRLFLTLMIIMLATAATYSQDDNGGYQTPPKAIKDLIDAPTSPAISINSSKDYMILVERAGYPTIEQVAQPMLRLGGLRINPKTNGRFSTRYYTGYKLQKIGEDKSMSVTGLPENAQLSYPSWSPNGKKIAFTVTQNGGIELWMADVTTRKAKKLTNPIVNAIMGTTFTWMGDDNVLVKVTSSKRGDLPKEKQSFGPVVQESAGKATTLRTYQDLLKNPHDEAVFSYYTASMIWKVNTNTGEREAFGRHGIIGSISVSPDENYVMVTYMEKPFSYLVTYRSFPTSYEVLDKDGKLVKKVADIPLVEQLPKGFGATRLGPRNINWREDKPATLYWAEAQDGGDPKKDVEYRDQLFLWDAPFDGKKVASIKFNLRFGGIVWGNDDLAIAYENWWPKRMQKISKFSPSKKGNKVVLFDRLTTDRYGNPGSFLTEQNEYGEETLMMANGGKTLFLAGGGASSEGDRPFLREFDVNTMETNELWRSQAPYYETPVEVLDVDKGLAIITRESKSEPRNYYIQNWKNDKLTPLTKFENPYPGLAGVEKEVIEFKRVDGVDMQGNLYLPKGYDKDKDGPLPVLMWAYPREYKNAKNAGQKSGSPYSFVRLSWGSAIYWVTQGYAVFDNVSMPVIGEGDAEPNDSFRKQLVDNAKAAIEVLVDMGVADRSRIGIGGHSYGAFMTANLMAHSDLFAAGIARSGAYNRTLTPFGFQREERTYWDSPETYYTMSPFMHADKINEPLLMVHGMADNNSGTFPLQSERLYQAINGLGGKARLVMLPHESHGYAARESILHTLYEMNTWLDKYVKNKTASARP